MAGTDSTTEVDLGPPSAELLDVLPPELPQVSSGHPLGGGDGDDNAVQQADLDELAVADEVLKVMPPARGDADRGVGSGSDQWEPNESDGVLESAAKSAVGLMRTTAASAAELVPTTTAAASDVALRVSQAAAEFTADITADKVDKAAAEMVNASAETVDGVLETAMSGAAVVSEGLQAAMSAAGPAANEAISAAKEWLSWFSTPPPPEPASSSASSSE